MSEPVSAVRIVDVPDERRYEARLGDELVGVATYRRLPDRITFIHTETHPQVAGKGVGSLLARTALDDARAKGLSVTPRCPFISAYMRRHPEYADLIDPTA